VCKVVKEAISRGDIDSQTVKSIAFAATCSLAVFTHDTNEPVEVSGSNSSLSGVVQNVILWMDRRADNEAASINSKGHKALKYLGGSMSVLMELPKVLWLKKYTPKERFNRYKFYDLNDALTHLATGGGSIPCTASCGQETFSLGVDGTVKGWDREFLAHIGLEDLAENGFEKVGRVCKVPPISYPLADVVTDLITSTVGTSLEVLLWASSLKRLRKISAYHQMSSLALVSLTHMLAGLALSGHRIKRLNTWAHSPWNLD
jgi:ribulose kinase